MDFSLNTRSSRAKRAKFAKTYADKYLLLAYKLIFSVSLVVGLGLLVVGESFGWLMLIPASVSITLLAWVIGDLHNDKPVSNLNGQHIKVDDQLEFTMLANLTTDTPSAYELWKALEKTEEKYFLANRFLIDGSYFEQLLDKTPDTAKYVWPIVENYKNQHKLDGYPNIAVLVALIASVPNHERILQMAKLEMKDIEIGIKWMTDIHKKRKLIKSKKFSGGVGRDWAFGYTPILSSLGYNVSRDIEMHGFFSDTSMHQNVVDQMTMLMNNGNGTVTLVGDTGVGKTTCVHAFADFILNNPSAPNNIKHNQIIALDAPTLLSRAKNPGELEELMIRIFNEAYKAKNIMLFFDDAEVFFGEGSTVDLSHIIQPALEAHSLRIILAMSPAAWQRLAYKGAIGKMQPLNIPPADELTTLAVLRDSISSTEYRNKVVFTYQALQEAYKLGERYVTNQAMPGAALTLLEQTANTASQQLITKEVVQASVEQTYGIKLQASTHEESSKLLNLEDELKKQVISQDRAVQVVSDALRRARSGIGNPNRPVGTFLFLGPTGVGKTELSKALARTYFGAESALIRLDMNQFVSSEDVTRLIQAMNGQELGFLGEVRKNPFSVILLDEIEKAHSSVVNSLLQMLDEGSMQDSENRAVSFKDAIIIATSNAGADEIRAMIDNGQDINQAESAFVETLISRGFFAPEFVNRFDEVVIFKPLDQNELTSVVDLILDSVNKNLDAQKVRVEVTEAGKKWLVDKGYDAKLGARPMRRVVQRYVENTVAKKLLEHSIQPGGTVQLDVQDFEQGRG